MNGWFRFDGMRHTSVDCPLSPCPEMSDRLEWMDEQGLVGICDLFGDEFGPVQIEVFSSERPGTPFIISVMLGESEWCNVICGDELTVLIFIGKYLAPLAHIDSMNRIYKMAERADEILFDETDGLQCAQRVEKRKSRERYDLRMARERVKREKEQASGGAK